MQCTHCEDVSQRARATRGERASCMREHNVVVVVVVHPDYDCVIYVILSYVCETRRGEGEEEGEIERECAYYSEEHTRAARTHQKTANTKRHTTQYANSDVRALASVSLAKLRPRACVCVCPRAEPALCQATINQLSSIEIN